MLAGIVGPIEGSRRIARFYTAVGDDDNPVFISFRGIDSESDSTAVGEDRFLWAQAFLDDLNRQYAAYDAALQPGIAARCEALIAAVELILRECTACGFSPLAGMPYGVAGEPSYEVCPCCGFQPGVTDELEDDAAEWRRRWIVNGMPFATADAIQTNG